MSLWWRDRVRILIAPDAVRVLRFGRGVRASVVESVPVVQLASSSADSYEHVIEALKQAVQSMGIRKADAEVLLSSHYVRFLLLPWNAELATDDERIAYARLEFEAIHGARARLWEIALDDQPAGAAALACAIDLELLQLLRSAIPQTQMRLTSIAPRFVSAFNRNRAKLSGKQAGFALVESGRITLAWFKRGAWQAIGSPRISGASAANVIAAELQQARTLGYVDEISGRIYLSIDNVSETLPASIGGWEIIDVEGVSDAGRLNRVVRNVAVTESQHG